MEEDDDHPDSEFWYTLVVPFLFLFLVLYLIFLFLTENLIST